MINERFGAWRVLELVNRKRNGATYRCRCDCGTERVVSASNLTSGRSLSCGCQKSARVSEARTEHGHAQGRGRTASPTYRSWASMIQRCTNPRSASYPNYGGRGITVCPQWLASFEQFLADMGEKPRKGMSIERVDSNRSYEPGNCIWADVRQQNRNRRSTQLTPEIVRALRDGSLSVDEAARTLGVSRSTLYAARSGQNWKDV